MKSVETCCLARENQLTRAFHVFSIRHYLHLLLRFFFSKPFFLLLRYFFSKPFITGAGFPLNMSKNDSVHGHNILQPYVSTVDRGPPRADTERRHLLLAEKSFL